MKISLVIPVFNEEKYIKNCLEAVMNQLVKPDEIIVIDNNCQDNTIAIAKKFPVQIIKEEKKGLIAARNKGYDSSKYDLIVRLDADAIPKKDWIKKIGHIFSSNKNIDAVFGPLVFYDLPLKTPLYSKTFYALIKLILGHNLLIGPNTAFKKDIWMKVRNNTSKNDDLIHEDIDLAIHINKIGGKIFYDPELINYVSGRRIRNNPYSFFIQYPVKLIRNIISQR